MKQQQKTEKTAVYHVLQTKSNFDRIKLVIT